jgi:ribosomal-protein-alanine N-acetyltransferase
VSVVPSATGARAPERVSTERLVLRRPRAADAEAVFECYASDPEATRFVSFRCHGSVAETDAFLEWSDAEWERWPAGPYLIERRGSGALLGGTGLAFRTTQRAATGYILARDAWGLGYATEALVAVVEVARGTGVLRLEAFCHPEHQASWRVLEKAGFLREGTLRRYAEFPNLKPGEPLDVLCYARVLG